jgi:hypothetical protein
MGNLTINSVDDFLEKNLCNPIISFRKSNEKTTLADANKNIQILFVEACKSLDVNIPLSQSITMATYDDKSCMELVVYVEKAIMDISLSDSDVVKESFTKEISINGDAYFISVVPVDTSIDIH